MKKKIKMKKKFEKPIYKILDVRLCSTGMASI